MDDKPRSYPARLDGRLDTDLSRWLWLVKWLLVIPPYRSRFPMDSDDNPDDRRRLRDSVHWQISARDLRLQPRCHALDVAGVVHATSAFGTDRYPPFTMRPDPSYLAEFTVDYPEQLSRGLVLVKW